MARYLLDTNVFINILTNDDDSLERDVQYILNDVDNEFLLSMESVKELLVAYRRKRLLSKIFPSAVKMIEAIQSDYGVRILQVDFLSCTRT